MKHFHPLPFFSALPRMLSSGAVQYILSSLPKFKCTAQQTRVPGLSLQRRFRMDPRLVLCSVHDHKFCEATLSKGPSDNDLRDNLSMKDTCPTGLTCPLYVKRLVIHTGVQSQPNQWEKWPRHVLNPHFLSLHKEKKTEERTTSFADRDSKSIQAQLMTAVLKVSAVCQSGEVLCESQAKLVHPVNWLVP